MPFHFCMDEVYMILGMIPFIGIFFRRLHAWYHLKMNHKCHHKIECPENHLEHKSKKYPGYLTQENMDEERKKLMDKFEADLVEGKAAYLKGSKLSDNPYPKGSPAFYDWVEGWETASKKDEEE